MKRKQSFLPFFLTFFIISILLILIGSTGIFDNFTSIVNRSSDPVKSGAYFLSLGRYRNQAIENLKKENQELKKKVSDVNEIMNENNALKSQFEASSEISQELLPVKIIGFPGFLPGVTEPDYLMIDKGENEGVRKGDTVLSNNFLVGKIIKTYPDFSKVELITNKSSSFTAKFGESEESNGIVKGQGRSKLVLENVLLTDELKRAEDVLTKGDIKENGEGYPPDILVGKIANVEKNQSDLFQKASIKSPIDFKNLETVFILK